jgi:hypothetical protein
MILYFMRNLYISFIALESVNRTIQRRVKMPSRLGGWSQGRAPELALPMRGARRRPAVPARTPRGHAPDPPRRLDSAKPPAASPVNVMCAAAPAVKSNNLTGLATTNTQQTVYTRGTNGQMVETNASHTQVTIVL